MVQKDHCAVEWKRVRIWYKELALQTGVEIVVLHSTLSSPFGGDGWSNFHNERVLMGQMKIAGPAPVLSLHTGRSNSRVYGFAVLTFI